MRLLSRLALLWLGVFLVQNAAAQAPTWQWAATTVSTGTTGQPVNAEATAVATDGAGRGYVAGSFWSRTGAGMQLQFGPASISSSASNGGSFVARISPGGQWEQATALLPIGGAGPAGQSYVEVREVVATAGGDVFVAGFAEAQAIQAGSQSFALPGGQTNYFVARFSPAGQCQWLVGTAVTPYNNLPASNCHLALDPTTGGPVLLFSFSGSQQVGSLPVLVAGGGGGALCVARLSAAGQWLSAVMVDGVNGSFYAENLAVGPQGQVAVLGWYFSGTPNLGGLPLPAQTGAPHRFFVAQLSPTNQWQWAQPLTDARPLSVAYRADGGVWLTGNGEVGSLVGNTPLTGPAAQGGVSYVGRLSAAGQWLGLTQVAAIGSGEAELGWAAADAQGNLVLIGYVSAYNAGPTSLAVGSTTLAVAPNETTLFVARLSAAGTWAYAQPMTTVTGSSANLTVPAFALDGAGNALVAGSYGGSLTIGATPTLGPTANREAFVARLSAAGLLRGAAASRAPTPALFPNPARTTATLTLPAAPLARPVTVLDALGRAVAGATLTAHATTAALPVAGLAPGVYVVRCGASAARLVVE